MHTKEKSEKGQIYKFIIGFLWNSYKSNSSCSAYWMKYKSSTSINSIRTYKYLISLLIRKVSNLVRKGRKYNVSSKRLNDRYYIYYPQQNGKLTCISTKTKSKKDAICFLLDFKTELKKRNDTKIISNKTKDLFFEFLKYSESVHRPKHLKPLRQPLM